MVTRSYISKTETVSTNLDLKEMVKASDSPVYAVISADSQTGGRGRNGKSFFSPKGGIYFSASFPLTGKEKNAPFITLLSGLAAAEALQKLCRGKLGVKWPNDIYINGKKLCGILTEMTKNTAVVGIGINAELRPDDIPEELKGTMTSLYEQGVKNIDKNAVIKEIVGSLDKEIYVNGALLKSCEGCVDKINGMFYLKNRNVKVISGNKTLFGEALRVSPTGALVLRTQNGEENVISGEIIAK